MYEIVITAVRIGYSDDGRAYPETQVYRYEYDQLEELEHVLQAASNMSLDGGQMQNR